MGFWIGDASDPWNMTEEEVTGGEYDLVGGSGPLAMFGTPAGGVTSVTAGLSKLSKAPKLYGAKAAGVVGLDLASGEGPVATAIGAEGGISAGEVFDGLDLNVPDPTGGWPNWLTPEQVILSLIATVIFALFMWLLRPLFQIGANTTGGD